MPLAVVDQRRSANARRIQRMGGVSADDAQQVEIVMPDDIDDEAGVIRDATGEIVRRL